MPLISTGTMGSNKSFGFSRGRLKVLTTFNFPAGTSTWTAPAGVTSLTSAVGKGANGSAASWQSQYNTIFSVQLGSQPSTISLNWASIYSTSVSTVSSINSGGSGVRTCPGGITYRFVFVSPSNVITDGANYTGTTATISGKTIRGTAVLVSSGSAKTSGSILYSEGTGYYGYTGIELLVAGTTGSSTTGFARTFPGGTESVPTATNTTFNNVAVSPGTQYTITNNGSLTITYYV